MSLANFTIICEHDNTCEISCSLHCSNIWTAKTKVQAEMIRHTHITDNESHDVIILDGGKNKIDLDGEKMI